LIVNRAVAMKNAAQVRHFRGRQPVRIISLRCRNAETKALFLQHSEAALKRNLVFEGGVVEAGAAAVCCYGACA